MSSKHDFRSFGNLSTSVDSLCGGTLGRTFSLNFDCRISQIIFDFLSWRKTNMFENMFFAELFVSQFQKQNQNKQHHCIFLLS